MLLCFCFFFFQAEDGIRDLTVTGVQTCALPICGRPDASVGRGHRRDEPLRALERKGGAAASRRYRAPSDRGAPAPASAWSECPSDPGQDGWAAPVERRRALTAPGWVRRLLRNLLARG